ncbi:MAG: PEP-CTERM sorting domain-containing protein [Acidobacteriota bacterium]|nr:PEP-CTERM sorting domain-containing protein [Acidobacteriota bacterium]
MRQDSYLTPTRFCCTLAQDLICYIGAEVVVMLLRCGRFCVALLSVGFLDLGANADTLSTWNGGSGTWSTAGNWTPSQVPNNTTTRSYDVTIGNGSATLDVSPTINSFTLNGALADGSDISTGQFTTLTVNGNASVNGTIPGHSIFAGWRDSLLVGRNFTNNGYMMMGDQLSVTGNVNNSGALILISTTGATPGLSVGGKVVNTGTLQFGDGIGDIGVGGMGDLVNRGSVFIAPGSNVYIASPVGVTNIPKGASWFIAGGFDGFPHLAGIEGSLDIEGMSYQNNGNSLALGSPGNTIHNSASFTIGSTFGPSVVNVTGNLSNTGDIEIASSFPPARQFGPSTLNVSGTLTNQATGTLNVNNPTTELYSPSPGALNAQKFVNDGTANFNAGTASTAQFFENRGTLNILGDTAGDIGSLTVGTLKPAAGGMTVFEQGGLLVVGSGPAPAGFTGYYQSADGVLDAAGGQLYVQDPVDLNGTLDIMLGNGYKPVGTVFTVLYGYGNPLAGAFSNVQGLTFDDGREKYLLTYHQNIDSGVLSGVFLTVENNTAPEPGSMLLVFLGLAGILATGVARNLRIARPR